MASLFLAIGCTIARRHFTDIADVFKVNAWSGYKVLAGRFEPIRNGEILILNKQ